MIKSLLESWNRYLLLELDYNEVKSKLDGDKFANSAKYHGVSPEEAKSSIMKTLVINPSTGQELDITEQDKANYLSWRIKQFMTKGSYQGPQPSSIETFYQIKTQKLDRFLTKNDINRIESIEEFEKIVKDASVGYESYIAEKAKASRKGNIIKLPSGAEFEIPNEAKLIIDDLDWLVYIPETKGAAIGLGLYTKWCTAAPGLNYYNNYHKPKNGDPLLIFISKNQKIPTEVIISTRIEQKTDRIGRVRKVKHHTKAIKDLPVRYQFSFGSKQFMDVNDNPIINKNIYQLLMVLLVRNQENLSDFIKKQLSAYTNNIESLPDGGTKEVKDFGSLGYSFRIVTTYRDAEGNIHRENGPAKIIEYADGFSDQFWYIKGVQHRDDGPALIERHRTTYSESWFKQGKLHRDDGPAITLETPSRKKEQWFKEGNNIFIKDFYKDTGRIVEKNYEECYSSGDKIVLNRLSGPISYTKDLDGNIEFETYFIKGREYTTKGYFDKLRKMGIKMPEPYYSIYLNKLSPKARQAQLHKDEEPKTLPEKTTPKEFLFDFGNL
jgi:hypothetical protein